MVLVNLPCHNRLKNIKLSIVILGLLRGLFSPERGKSRGIGAMVKT
jgi:hypothetical protein